MIGLEQVSFGYGEKQETLSHVSATVARGECVLLCGASGCGKTTTLKMINRLIQPDSGHIYLGGQDVAKTDRYQLRRRIGAYVKPVADISRFHYDVIFA